MFDTKSYLKMRKIIFILLLLTFTTSSFSQKKEFDQVSIDELINETQYSSDSTDNIELIWWIPTEYWNVVFAADETISKAEGETIIKLLQKYVTVICIKGKIGVFGGVTYETEETVKSNTHITFKGDKLKLADSDILNPDLVNFLSIIKPMMKNMLGALGENMQIFLFENPEGKSILPIDPYSDEDILFELANFKKHIQLPLGSLLEEKICPNDNKEHSGKWKYCPFHGDVLISK